MLAFAVVHRLSVYKAAANDHLHNRSRCSRCTAQCNRRVEHSCSSSCMALAVAQQWASERRCRLSLRSGQHANPNWLGLDLHACCVTWSVCLCVLNRAALFWFLLWLLYFIYMCMCVCVCAGLVTRRPPRLLRLALLDTVSVKVSIARRSTLSLLLIGKTAVATPSQSLANELKTLLSVSLASRSPTSLSPPLLI